MRQLLTGPGWGIARVLFRPTLTGGEHLPEGPFLLVSNHNAGMGFAEIFCFAVLYVRTFGIDRPLAGFAHHVAFKLWPLSVLLTGFGAIPSTYDAAYGALAAGVPVLVFPGGDHETLRPVWQANRVDFGGRKGFLRIAQKAGVPIVPMGITGSHYTAPMLWRSRFLAWFFVVPALLGVRRWGVSALGAFGALAIAFLPLSWPVRLLLMWLWAGSPLTFVPIVPWTIRFRIGPPLSAAQLAEPTDAQVPQQAGYDLVVGAVQALVSGAGSDAQ
jgi:1-acyl-sn-glycerol-3-phosphate acyltransferase